MMPFSGRDGAGDCGTLSEMTGTSGRKPAADSTSPASRRAISACGSPMMFARVGNPWTGAPSRNFLSVVPMDSFTRVSGPSSSWVACASARIRTSAFLSQNGCTPSP